MTEIDFADELIDLIGESVFASALGFGGADMRAVPLPLGGIVGDRSVCIFFIEVTSMCCSSS
jgi:hypothetical protein